MSERDANQHLVDTARMNVDALRHDPLEDTQSMDVADRRKRTNEAANHHLVQHTLPESMRIERERPMTIISRRMRRDEALKLWPMSPKVKP